MTQIYLDTHIAIWLAQKKLGKLSKKAKKAIEGADIIHIPAMVELELQLLSEIGKIKIFPIDIIAALNEVFTLQRSTALFLDICNNAKSIGWTRDMFDRLIVAETMCARHAWLLTADANIHAHYKRALW